MNKNGEQNYDCQGTIILQIIFFLWSEKMLKPNHRIIEHFLLSNFSIFQMFQISDFADFICFLETKILLQISQKTVIDFHWISRSYLRFLDKCIQQYFINVSTFSIFSISVLTWSNVKLKVLNRFQRYGYLYISIGSIQLFKHNYRFVGELV